MIIKKRRGDGPTMHTFKPNEFDCMYYNAFGYCRLRRKQALEQTGIMNTFDELLELYK